MRAEVPGLHPGPTRTRRGEGAGRPRSAGEGGGQEVRAWRQGDRVATEREAGTGRRELQEAPAGPAPSPVCRPQGAVRPPSPTPSPRPAWRTRSRPPAARAT